ncbi:cag pathogenicity island Cag12 family protein [Aggregatibacter actinomycetemcomitans]|uniref:cag pathogenicity island Cag12 family protein n=1 Tax=Aggregatibacter actinomycetemcomitans TaxID=714 RepID=UPI00197B8296|nr:cag pathogenicity island Cag12 family protein [Aggregatibacter actinomycetemcomitans]MBN6059379.1 hypothetical protein [Aggregatibacter actinomycetemcomitans]MBN6087880.1 hypothetical protein [Aggregatibacter actinomycetemcomitans]
MKKSLSISLLLTACFLSGCSETLPKPPQLDEELPPVYLNNNVYQQTPVNHVPKNAGDHNGKNWTYQYVNLDRPDYVSDSGKVRFFYFAHHANEIEIYGQPARTEAYKYWLQANGVSAAIQTYVKDLPKNSVNITFKGTGAENEKSH